MNKFPYFVRFGGKQGVALRHIGKGEYYRDAGKWSVHSMWKNGKLVCSDRKGKLAHVFGEELLRCYYKSWRENNLGYVPKFLERETKQNDTY